MRIAGVLPLHNHAAWVGDAIASLADQSLTPSLICVCDDGSSDGSWQAAHEAGRKHGIEVRIARHDKPKGPSAARNAAMGLAAEAGADWFALLDSDDLYLPGKIELSLRLAGPGVGCVYSDFETWNPSGFILRQWKPPFSRERLVRECIVNCDSLVSRAAIEACGGFPESMRVCEDYALWLEMSKKWAIKHVPECLVRIRVGPHSSTATVPQERWQADYAEAMRRAN